MLISSDSRTRCWAFLGLTLIAWPSLADTPATQDQVQELCTSLGESATYVLLARENGLPLSKVLELSQTSTPEMTKFAREMAMMAYDLPHFSTPEMQAKQSQDFRNQIELMCFRAYGG